MQTLGSIPKHGISLCMVEKRRVEEELREFSFQAVELFISFEISDKWLRTVIG